MAQRGIREYDGKRLLARYWPKYFGDLPDYEGRMILVTPESDLESLPEEYGWLAHERLVVKPDQLFGKRGKQGLVKVVDAYDEAKRWIQERMNHDVTVGAVTDRLTHFMIEPYVPHEAEYYIAIRSERAGDTLYLSNHGGVDIEEVWDTVAAIHVGVLKDVSEVGIGQSLPADTPVPLRQTFTEFAAGLLRFYRGLGFTYLEINPFVLASGAILPLDLVARLDDTAHFEHADQWGNLEFPAPFGRRLTEAEQYIKELDEKSGASLKLTLLNPGGRIWTLVAGGGASVVYTDTIVDLGYGQELANYGEYSGNPTTSETYEYARTVLDLMTRERDPLGRAKYLLIGGGIANFTDVAKTFSGITKALREYKERLVATNVRVFVRRGGPNYEQGLRIMKQLGDELGVPVEVYGPEMHMTRIVDLALEDTH